MSHRVLILGGTTEARQLASQLATKPDVELTLSLAGRTENPIAQQVPTRIGGFGGAEGLSAYLKDTKADLVIDATHPYAARISANAAKAAQLAGVPILALRRPGWERREGDRWTEVDDAAAAAAALGLPARRVFLALGRQEVGAFEAAAQHRYLLRSVDPVEPPLGVPHVDYLLARGPFREADEHRLLVEHRIDVVVCKNSGGEATYGKIAAARALGIEVVMIRRPMLPTVPSAPGIPELLAMVDHSLRPVAERGV